MTPLSLRLRELRQAKRLTQLQLAHLSGVPQPTISKLENGEQESIAFAQLEALADALEVNAAVLIEHTPRPKPRLRGRG